MSPTLESDETFALARGRRTLTLALVALAIILFWMLGEAGLGPTGTTQSHTLVEVAATIFALVVGVVALIRHYARKRGSVLLLGVGFLGAALLDGYHALVTSTFFDQLLPSPPPSLIPWSWNASRTFLALLMLWSIASWTGHSRGMTIPTRDRWIYLFVGATTATTFLFFAFVPLGRAHFSEAWLGRPQELVAGAMFALALAGYLKKSAWRSDYFELAIVIFLVISTLIQFPIMARSHSLFDIPFMTAHLLKVVSYGVVFAGLLRDLSVTWRREAAMSARLRSVNEELEDRVRARTVDLERSKAALERSNRELQQFAYIASHDLKTPLRTMSGFAELVAKRYSDSLDEQGRDWLNRVVEGTNRMRVLIDDLLQFSRVETEGREGAPVELDEVVDDTTSMIEALIEETGATITRDALPLVTSDRSQLIRLFHNLLENAIRYRSDQPPAIHISAENLGHEWKISVRDNGIGIAPEHQERIFRIFQRLHSQRDYEGTGIGLAVCKRIVQRHGGEIGVSSDENEGSTFYFTLPAGGSE